MHPCPDRLFRGLRQSLQPDVWIVARFDYAITLSFLIIDPIIRCCVFVCNDCIVKKKHAIKIDFVEVTKSGNTDISQFT